MGLVVTFENIELSPRFDGTPWTHLEIREAPDVSGVPGSWTLIDSQTIEPVPADPTNPDPLFITTEDATLAVGLGWYKIKVLDVAGDSEETAPIFNSLPVEIMCALDDINGNLDGVVIRATSNNTRLIQTSVTRVIRAYLSRVVDQPTIMTWLTPAATPDIIREVAAKLIAAQLYINEASRSSLIVEDNSFAQKKYDEAMAILNEIIQGTITLPGIVDDTVEGLTINDFFPIDATDRSFTRSQVF